jgi:hypothetical protein
MARNMFNPITYGGLDGQAGSGSSFEEGIPGEGAGVFVIRANGAIENGNGLILADGGVGEVVAGSSGSGGGGGGWVVMASATSINPGTISVRGGWGSDAALSSNGGGGGGGGGGIVHLIGPNASEANVSNVDVGGGDFGLPDGGSAYGGGSGGGLGGAGGTGGDDDGPVAETNGASGFIVATDVSDPGPLFF